MKFWISCVFGFGLLLAGLAWGFSQWNLRYYTEYIGDRLELLAELRRGALQEYFATAEAELRFWSRSARLIEFQQELVRIREELGDAGAADIYRLYVKDNPHPDGFMLNLDDAEDGGLYSAVHARLHPVARQFVTRRGYYDLFLIGPAGNVLYTVEKETDFAANLETGPLRNSGLAEVFAAARSGQSGRIIATSDMRPYAPSEDAPAIFMATALHGEEGDFIGVLALQLPTDRILGIMSYTAGMGETGETYLVGEDLLMRSDSRFSAASTVLSQRVDTPAVARALAGEQGRDMIADYRGVRVLSGFVPLQLGEHRWAVMAEMDEAEISVFAAQQRPPVAGALGLIYGLSLWSVWYWRGRRLPEESLELPVMELADADAGGAIGP